MAVDTSIVLTDEVIDGLLDDWFERDGETFVKVRKTGRLGWEERLDEGDSYSAYLLESPTDEDLIKRAYSLAKETIIAMDTPFKVHIKISPGSDSFTDSRVLCVSTKMFDDPDLSVGEKIDTFLGVTVHEGCHLLYTDFTIKETVHPVIKTLWNILEDERIEQLCGENKPGLANFLEKSKYYYFDMYYIDYVAPKEREGTLTPFDRIMNVFLHIIRYPKYLKEEEIIEFGHYLLEVKKLVLPYPESTKDALKVAKKIFDILKDFYVEEEKSKSESLGESVSESEIAERALGSLLKDSEESISALKGVAGDSRSAPAFDGGGLSAYDVSKEVLKDHGLLGELCEGTVEIGAEKDVFFTKATEDKTVYSDSLRNIKRYVPSIARILKGHCKDYKLTHRSMRSGVLDTNKLVEAVQGVPTVYIREGEVKTEKVSVCVLIDESGSMWGPRIKSARDAAILINEAIGSVPGIELFIYGHSGDEKRTRSTELFVYREKNYNPRFSLGSVKARSQNRDGVAILETAQRVRKQTQNPVIFFILSDGAPCAGGYSGTEAFKHVKENVLKVERMGFSVIQVCINHSYDPGLMFKNFIILENLSTLALELGKAIKKTTMTAAKVTVR